MCTGNIFPGGISMSTVAPTTLLTPEGRRVHGLEMKILIDHIVINII